MGDIVTFTDVTKVFGQRSQAHTALSDISFGVREGSITGVIGYSGAGKSTLVRLVNALELPTQGSVKVDGQEVTTLSESGLRALRSQIGMIFQQFNLFASRSVAKNVEYPLKLAGWPKAKRTARVRELLEFVGISDKAKSRPGALSGGQQQRVGIARALATDPKILLADEATSALDPETTQDVLALLAKVNRELGTTILVITHEMHVVRTLCNDVAVLENGRLLEAGPVYDIFAFPKNEATRRFISSTIQDLPSEDTLERLRARHSGRLVSVGVVERNGEEPTGALDVARAVAQVGSVTADVVYGSVTEISERPFGSLTYSLSGPPEATARVVELVKERASVIDWSATSAGEVGK